MSTPATPSTSTPTHTAAVARVRPTGASGHGGAQAATGQPASPFARLLQGLDTEGDAPDAAPAEPGDGAPADPEATADGAAAADPRDTRRPADDEPGAPTPEATLPPEQRAATLGQAGWLAAARARAQAADAAARGRHAAGALALADDPRAQAGADEARTLAAAAGRADAGAAAEPGALALDPAAWQAAAAQAAAEPKALTAEPAPGQPHGAEFALPSLGEGSVAPAPADAAPPPGAAQATLEPPPGSAAFPAALGAQLRTWLQDGVEYATLELNPQDMGPIDVRIALQGGQTRVELGADVGATRQALADALPALAEALGDVGLSLAGGSVADQTGQHARPGDDPAQRAFALPGWLAPARAGAADAAAAATPRAARGLVDLVA